MTERATLLLSRGDAEKLLDIGECIEAVQRAFELHVQGRTLRPGVLGIPAPGGGFHIKAAGLQVGQGWFAVKLNANFFGNAERLGLPNIIGLILLCDAGSGVPLAVIDSIQITILRTAAATAVAARFLAPAGAEEAAILGCGNQGRSHLSALTKVLPLRRARAWDIDPLRAVRFAERMSAELGLEVRPAAGPAEAARDAPVVVTCTPSREPFLRPRDVAAGAFVAAIGADSADKQELHPGLLASAAVVVDHLDQCASFGELRHAIDAGLITLQQVRGELPEIAAGRIPGRLSEREIIVFDSTGTALQDVAAAVAVYERAIRDGVGVAFDFAR